MMTYPVWMDCDVLVVGGGPAGTMAGVAAARAGACAVILESNGFLGGNLTAAGIDTMYGLYTVDENPQPVIGGLVSELIDRMKMRGACYLRKNTYGAGSGMTMALEDLKIVLEEMALEAGARLLYHTMMPEMVVEEGSPTAAVTASKNGLQQIRAKAFIDCSGDADVVARSGGPFEKPGEVGPVQSCTTVFFMANVEMDRYKAFGKQAMWDAMEAAVKSGKYNLPRIEGSFHATPEKTLIEANMTRIRNVDTINTEEVTQAEITGRKQVQEYVRFLKENVPGFEKAYLVQTGSHIGVREGRRAVGEYVLTRDDVLEGRRFDDAVLRCGQPIEDHHAGSDTVWGYVHEHGYYDIPYRCLVPRGLENVWVAGRCLSATHDAHASARSSATAMAMGQAAGQAAVIAIEQRIAARDVNIQALQSVLRKNGALI